ncbi:SGNH/GDSL hydrolase family protein [Methylocella tundrae]|uniref:Uncharacterized protein n=1 Tax=Methylocella tundrae TaxID=227605 RepID=A0A4U8Z0I8_METTU|nr:SGNH/GDSL hydrolase family protein [Methylocella tundrae]WPP05590.1 SGNH/GDSL hydrolase family protein [Methylocella tundrae]VFU08038.1 conserved protein of unknown function [Methylocella tundrae]
MRLAAIPLLAAIIAAVEIRHSPDFFRLISFVLVFLIAADLASLARGALRDALLIVASLLFGLCVIEATAATLEDRQVIVSTNGWNVRQPVIGWGPQHAGRFHSEKTDPKTGAIIYSAEYTIDSNLLRQTRSTDAGSTIAFFGDSVTFGVGVNDPDTLPQRFADVLDSKERVINLAFTGYGPQHFLREMETGIFDAEIGPHPRLFVFVTSPWHAERTSCKASWVVNAPRYELDNGKVTFRGACYEGASLRLREFLWNTAAYRVVFDPYRRKASHDDIETYIRILLAAVDLAKEKYGVPTLIPFLRSPDAYLRGTGFTNEAIMERLQQGGASVIDVSLLKEEAAGAEISIPGDGHPTPLANRMRAAMLKSYIEQNMAGVLYSQLN